MIKENLGVATFREERIRSFLEDFKIKHTDVYYDKSKYFDYYEIRLAPGTQCSSIEKILKELGMYLKSYMPPSMEIDTRKGCVRIKVQTREIKSSMFSDFIPEIKKSFYSGSKTIPLGLGVDSNGNFLIEDAIKIPNILIGGSPGSGKSMLLHSIIASSIISHSIVHLVDPKLIEFGVYNECDSVKSISYNSESFLTVLKDVIDEMEKRFRILKKYKSRNLHELNRKYAGKKWMPPIMLLIDEWADIYYSDKSLEDYLVIIAQKGRAAGISVVLATQRPTSKIISGAIKACFSGRISLRVPSAVDSRIILDSSGAEKIKDVGCGYYKSQYKDLCLFRSPIINIENNLLEICENVNKR